MRLLAQVVEPREPRPPQREAEVLANGESRKHGGNLQLAADSLSRHVVGRRTGNARPFENDAPRICRQAARQDIEGRCLARSVRPMMQ